jgi:hypothetical protein
MNEKQRELIRILAAEIKDGDFAHEITIHSAGTAVPGVFEFQKCTIRPYVTNWEAVWGTATMEDIHALIEGGYLSPHPEGGDRYQLYPRRILAAGGGQEPMAA